MNPPLPEGLHTLMIYLHILNFDQVRGESKCAIELQEVLFTLR